MTTATDPAPVADLAKTELMHVRIDEIAPNPNNPRRIDDSHPSLVGLAESITATGLIQPITVCDYPCDENSTGPFFQILAGERRWRASRLAGLTTILVRHVVVTPEQAFHIVTVENLQREDLHWLEESRGVEAMLKHGWDPATIAKQIGKSEQWVRIRAKLAAMSPAWRKAVEGDPYQRWPVAMLELIARLPIERQEAMLKRKNTWALERCETTAHLHEYLDEHELLALPAARWDLDDAKLVPKAGACSACPKRSSCQQQLFADTKDDRCLDATCWAGKTQAWMLGRLADFRAKHPKGLLFGNSTNSDLPKAIASKLAEKWRYTGCKEKDEGAVPVLWVDGDTVGRTCWFRPQSGCGGGGEKPTKQPGEAPKQKPAKERLAEFLKRRRRAEVRAVIAKLGGDPDMSPYQARHKKPKAATADVVQPDCDTLIALALAHGLPNDAQTRDWPAFVRFMDTDVDKLHASLWDDLRARLVQVLGFDAEQDANAEGAQAIAACCSIDWKAIVSQVQDTHPLPKSLAVDFLEDGTKRTGVTAGKKSKPLAKPVAKAKPKAKAAKS